MLQAQLANHKIPREERVEYQMCLIRTKQLHSVVSRVKHSHTDPCNLPKELFQLILEYLPFEQAVSSRQVSFSRKTVIEGSPYPWRDFGVLKKSSGPAAPAFILRFLELSDGRTRIVNESDLRLWQVPLKGVEEVSEMKILQNLPRLEKLYFESTCAWRRVMPFILSPAILTELHVMGLTYDDFSYLSQALSHGFFNLKTLSVMLEAEEAPRVLPWPTAGSLPALRSLLLEGDAYGHERSLNTIDAAAIQRASPMIEVLSLTSISDYAARSGVLHGLVPTNRPAFSDLQALKAIRLVPQAWYAFLALPKSLHEFTFCAEQGRDRLCEEHEVGQIPFLPELRLLQINTNIATKTTNVWVELLRRSNCQFAELKFSDWSEADESDESVDEVWVEGLLFELLRHDLLRHLQSLMFSDANDDDPARHDDLFELIMEKRPKLTTLTWGPPCYVSQKIVDTYLHKRRHLIYTKADTYTDYYRGEGIRIRKK